MRVAAALIWAVALAAIQGCASTQSRTAAAADRLGQEAEAFAAATCNDRMPSCSTNRTARSAQELSEQVHEFRRALDRGSDQDVVFAFKHLWSSYHTLLHQTDTPGNVQMRTELGRLKLAFTDVQRHVKTGYSHADPDLYASGGYLLDPYYN